MNAAEVTRLRVAQAARQPVMVEHIRAALVADEAAENASVERVERIADDWVEQGILRRTEAGRYVQERVFEDDTSRRVAGHLLRPRTLLSLEREIARDEVLPNLRERDLEPFVNELIEAGLVVDIGKQADAASLAAAVDDHADTIDLHPSSRALLEDRLAHERHSWEFESGPFFVLSRKGLDALQVT